MHTSMFIWKPHPGKLKEMREMVITIRDHCRRIGGANEINCAALQGSFFGHFAVAMRCENGVDTEKALEGFRADEKFMEVMADAYQVGEIVEHFTGRRL